MRSYGNGPLYFGEIFENAKIEQIFVQNGSSVCARLSLESLA